MALKQLLAALAAVGTVAAQCSVSGTSTIQNQGDATAFASCTTFTGSIAVATGTTDNINIASVRAVTGDISVMDAPNITTFGADSIQQIGGTFTLNNCQILSSINWPQLTSVGNLDFEALPNLQQFGFTSSIGEANTINIQNTFLTTLNGINLQKVTSVFIENNPRLQAVSMQVSNISQSLTIASNGQFLQASFPNLLTAQNLTFRDCPTVSIPSLNNVTGSLGFYSNSFQSLNTPNLTLVGGTLAFVSNTQLSNISMPGLNTVTGGLQVQNNTELLDMTNAFPGLKTIGGALDFYGNFTNVTLPSLSECRGAFNLQSSADITSDCNTFKNEAGRNSVIQGTFTCAGDQTSPGGSPSGTSSSTSTKKSDARHLDISSNAAIGIGSVLAAILGMF